MDNDVGTKRRQLLVRGLRLAGACALGIAGGSHEAAGAKSSKAAFLYQDHPQNGKSCGDCKFFSPDGSNPSAGTCAIVEGTVGRSGWCMAFSTKT